MVLPIPNDRHNRRNEKPHDAFIITELYLFVNRKDALYCDLYHNAELFFIIKHRATQSQIIWKKVLAFTLTKKGLKTWLA